MRLIIAGLLVIGGGLAALALVWAFYSTQSPAPTSTTRLSLNKVRRCLLIRPRLLPQKPHWKIYQKPPRKAWHKMPGQAQHRQLRRLRQTVRADTGLPPAMLQIEVVRIGPDGSAVFAGRGSAAADVQIFEQDKTLARTTVAPSGEWVAIADEPLSPGNHLIIVELRTPERPAGQG